MQKVANFFTFIVLFAFFSIFLVSSVKSDPDLPITEDFSEFDLCTIPSSVFTGGCCSGAGELPTLNWELSTSDTFCDDNGLPITTIPTFKGIATDVSAPSQDNICGGCMNCSIDHSYQVSYWLQIDNDPAFTSPEFDTGEVVSGVRSFTVPLGSIPSGTYYWQVGIKDQFGSVTSWVADGNTFTMPLDCSSPAPGSPLTPGGSTNEVGSEATVCVVSHDQPPPGGCYDGNYPVVRLDWSFTSSESDWSDNDGWPLTAQGDALVDNPYIPAVTQQGYWLEVDDDINFGSIDYRTGYVASTDEFHRICFDVLDFNTTYYWRVAVLDSQDSIGSDGTTYWAYDNALAFTTVDKCAPDAPTDLAMKVTPQPTSCSFLKAEWTDNSDNEDGFLVERSLNGTSGWTEACDVESNVNSCYVAMPYDTTWYFRVRAYTSGGNSTWEPPAGTGTGGTDGIIGTSYAFCAPVIDIATANCDCANISWTILGDETQVHHYKVERSVNGGAWEVLDGNIPQGTLHYDDCDIQSGIKLYEYVVIAYDDAAESFPAESDIYELLYPCQRLPLWKESK